MHDTAIFVLSKFQLILSFVAPMACSRSRRSVRLADEGRDCSRCGASLDQRPGLCLPPLISIVTPSTTHTHPSALSHQHSGQHTLSYHLHTTLIATTCDHTHSNQAPPFSRRHAQLQRADCDSPSVVRFHPRHRTAATSPCVTQTRTSRQQQPHDSGWRCCACSLVLGRLPVSALRRVAVALMLHLATTDQR